MTLPEADPLRPSPVAPDTGDGGPGASPLEPRTSPVEPRTSSVAPDTGDGGPGAGPVEPRTGPVEPVASPVEPVTGPLDGGAGDEGIVRLLRQLLAAVVPDLDAGAVTSDTEVASLGISSIQLLELVGDIEDALGVVLPDDELTTLRTVRDLVAVVAGAAG